MYIPTPVPLAAPQQLAARHYGRQQQQAFGADTSVVPAAAVFGAARPGSGAAGVTGLPPGAPAGPAARARARAHAAPAGWVLDGAEAAALAAAAAAPAPVPPRAQTEGAGTADSEPWWGHPSSNNHHNNNSNRTNNGRAATPQYASSYAAGNAAPALLHAQAWQAANPVVGAAQPTVGGWAAPAAGADPHRAWAAAEGGVAAALMGPAVASNAYGAGDDRWERDVNRPLQRNASAMAARANAQSGSQQQPAAGMRHQPSPAPTVGPATAGETQMALARPGARPERVAVAVTPTQNRGRQPQQQQQRAQTPPRAVPVRAPSPPVTITRPGSRARRGAPSPLSGPAAATPPLNGEQRRAMLAQQHRRAAQHNHMYPSHSAAAGPPPAAAAPEPAFLAVPVSAQQQQHQSRGIVLTAPTYAQAQAQAQSQMQSQMQSQTLWAPVPGFEDYGPGPARCIITPAPHSNGAGDSGCGSVHAHRGLGDAGYGYTQQQQQSVFVPLNDGGDYGDDYDTGYNGGGHSGHGHGHGYDGHGHNSGAAGGVAEPWVSSRVYTPMAGTRAQAAAQPRVVVAVSPALTTQHAGGLHGPHLRARAEGPAGGDARFYLREPPAHTEPGPYCHVDRYGKRCFVGAPVGLGSLFKKDRAGDARETAAAAASKREGSARPRENPRSASARSGPKEGVVHRVVGEKLRSHQNNDHFNIYD